MSHKSVLLDVAVDSLNIVPDAWYVDGTYGRGGHSRAILARLNSAGRLLVIDQDPQAIADAKKLSEQEARCVVKQGGFQNVGQWVSELGIKPMGVLLDLGVSSPQLDDAERGFSFLQEGPLDMRMDTTCGLTAAQWLSQVGEVELAKVLKEFGEERYSRRIAAAIIKARKSKAIKTTAQLANIVAQACPSREKGKHPATRTFQAVRIYINQELLVLKEVLAVIARVLAVGGRLVVISFHSLEDRMVKQFVRDFGREVLPPHAPIVGGGKAAVFRALSKPVRPTVEEIDSNPRARSAVLRVAEKVREP